MIDVWLALALCFAVVAMIIITYTRRVVEMTLTDQFRAAESLAQGRIPAQWQARIQRRLSLERVMTWGREPATGARLAIQNLDRLVLYFERSPFFENEEARGLLLTKLRETRGRWQAMTWEQIQDECC